ncbi:YdjY domain-containing protein [Desulfuribacillus alkaliarsenatis]|uniref:4Fe-4S ferredoxin-type domain-containing protein n=1 Tax=Desulfuribacillus alkaliarsenatis TaxID=766136 RepID=A0A1E5FZC5_9FIRM|nr:YdjY domain-containing protein [Desulfuribacillus alkaliarsenatis]OEF95934.1 hypothetical protein BHF68_11125 [Desulfuribacillus alkaliarsenatis]
MTKKLWFIMLATLILGMVMLGCSSNQEATETQAATGVEVSESNPLVIDQQSKTISVYAKVNGKYLIEPTRHGMNFHEGRFGDQAVLAAYANPLNFHDAMIELGATPGNNVTMDNMSEKLHIEGQDLEVTITWAGADRVYDINEVLIDSAEKPFVFKFGGNYERHEGNFTGCLLCLDSCPVGITSNSSHPTTTFDSKVAEFKGNADILPSDGTPVVVTYKIK